MDSILKVEIKSEDIASKVIKSISRNIIIRLIMLFPAL